MSKKTTEESQVTAVEPVTYTTRHLSTDEDNGVVVFETDAPDGTLFRCDVGGQLPIAAIARSGQIWFHAPAPIPPFAPIALLL